MLTKSERFYKNLNVRFVQVFSKAIAKELIKKKKYFYYFGETKHYKTGEIVNCYEFEYTPEIFDDIKKIKAELNARKKDGVMNGLRCKG